MLFITDYLTAFIFLLLLSLVLKFFNEVSSKSNSTKNETVNSKFTQQENILIEFSVEKVQHFKEIHLIGSNGQKLVFENTALVLICSYEVNWNILRRGLAFILNTNIDKFDYFYYNLKFGDKLKVIVNNEPDDVSSEKHKGQKLFKYKASSIWFETSFTFSLLNNITDSSVISSNDTFFLTTLFNRFISYINPEEIESGSVDNYKSTLFLKNNKLDLAQKSNLKDSTTNENNGSLNSKNFNFKINNLNYKIDSAFSLKQGKQINTWQFLKINR